MRLINTKKKLSFKNWIAQHDPKLKWDFNDPIKLKNQFTNIIAESGDIDLQTIYELFYQEYSELTPTQHQKFDSEEY